MSDLARIDLEIEGLGILLYSPSHAAEIPRGTDFLATHYLTEEQVQPYIQAGTLVAFGTGSPGTFNLIFRAGYPADRLLADSEFKLRLGLHVVDGIVCVRDLYDLVDWQPECPASQSVGLENGYYHVTLCSDVPASGVLGDDQVVYVFLHPLPRLPALATQGIPTLCV